MKLVNKKEGVGESKLDDYHPGEKEEMCFTNSSEDFCVNGAVAGALCVVHSQDKIVRSHNSASYDGKEPRSDAAEIEAECATNLGPPKCHSEYVVGRESHQKYGFKRTSGSGNPKLAKHLNPEFSCESARHGCIGLTSNNAEQNGTPITIHLSNYTLSSQQCSSDIAPLNLQNESKLVSPAAVQPQDAGTNEKHEANYHSIRSEKEKEHQLNERCQEKGKEKILQCSEDCCSTSKNREDSSESVESRNSEKLVLRGKRPWNFDPNYLGCKKLKKEVSGSSGSQVRKDSSFLNWMSSMTKNLSRFDHTKFTSLHPQSSNMNEKFDSVPMTVNSGDAFFQSRGFTSMFQALTRPSVILQNRICGHDHQRVDSGSEELKVDNPLVDSEQELNLNSFNFSNRQMERSSNGAIRIGGLTECGKLHAEEHNQGDYQVQEHPLASFDVSPNPSTIHEKMGHKMWQIGVRKIIEPPSCSIKNHCIRSEENVNRTTCIPNKCINVELNDGSDLFENLWVARFLRRKSSSNLNFDGCRFGVNLHTVSQNNGNCLVDNSWRAKGIYDKYPQNTEHNHGCHLGSRRSILSGQLKRKYDEYPQNTENYHWGSRRSILSGQLKGIQKSHSSSSSSTRAQDKIRSNISPILPSQMFKNSEPLASVFAKRLDALRHILSSKISDSLSHAATTCLFCGKSGHNIRNCSALAESDKILLHMVESCDGNDTSSSFCIRCFQFNHWAIACPGAASKVKNSCTLFMPGNMRFGRNQEKLHIDKAYHRDKRVFLRTNRRGNSKDEAVCAANRNSSASKLVPSIANDLCSKECLLKSTIEDKNKISYYRDNESKVTKALNPCKSTAIEVVGGQNEIFEAIKKLQLSRTDIMRSLKSPKACPPLEGFFLRLRLGKWEKGRGGTGYHVARIKGVSCENNISVGIGYLTCSVDYRFVSNHDFTEDELKAWCSATLKCDGILPSKDELDMKFRERAELGF